MKKVLLLFFILSFGLSSCEKTNEQNLINRITKLKTENKKLKDSITSKFYNKLMNSTMVGFPNKDSYSKSDSGKVFFYFKYSEKLPRYNVYTTNKNLKPDKLILENQNTNQFEIPFDVENLEKNEIKVIAVFKEPEIKIIMSTKIPVDK